MSKVNKQKSFEELLGELVDKAVNATSIANEPVASSETVQEECMSEVLTERESVLTDPESLEFNKVLTDPESLDPVSMKQNVHQEVCYEAQTNNRWSHCEALPSNQSTELDTSEVKPSKRRKRLALSRARELSKKMRESPIMPRDYMNYAAVDPVCKKLFWYTGNLAKPKWAVRALVLYRDKGVCRVCNEVCELDAKVVMKKPYAEGGQYDEVNCIAVCTSCAEVWSRYKNFYVSPFEQLDELRQFLWIMRKRASAKKNVKVLSSVGMQRYKELLSLLESQQVKAEVEKEKLVSRLTAGILTNVVKSGEEFVGEILTSMKAHDSLRSESEINKSGN